jgi:hypothetical protein
MHSGARIVKAYLICLVIAVFSFTAIRMSLASNILFEQDINYLSCLSPKIIISNDIFGKSYADFTANASVLEIKSSRIQGTLIRNKHTGKVVLIAGNPRAGKSELAKLLVSSEEFGYLKADPSADWEFLGEETIELFLVKNQKGAGLVCRINKAKAIGIFRYLNWRYPGESSKVSTDIDAIDGYYNLNAILMLGHNELNAQDYIRRLEAKFEADFSSMVEMRTILIQNRDPQISQEIAVRFNQLFTEGLNRFSFADILIRNQALNSAI